MGLTQALDQAVRVTVEQLLSSGAPPDSQALYQSIQRSNSSLKRRPKKVLEASIERVLDFLEIDKEDSADSEAELDNQPTSVEINIMNRSLRANLSQQPVPARTERESSPKRRKANGESLAKRQKTTTSIEAPQNFSLEDIGGMPDVIEQLDELLVIPLLAPESYLKMGLSLPRGALLHGPPGCGKTSITKAFAAALGLPFIQILGPSIVSGMSGESEKGIREKFEEAKRNAPCLLFIDEIDAIAPKRESSQSQMEKRIVAQLLISMDELEEDQMKPVIVLAATNRPDTLDPALRRGGRFGTEINIGVPNEQARASILAAQTRKLTLASDVDFNIIAKHTAGFVGADLRDLIEKAGAWQLKKLRSALLTQAADLEMDVDEVELKPQKLRDTLRLITRLRRKDVQIPTGFESMAISMKAFMAVLPTITPSSKREGFATVPDVSWADIGALDAVREELDMAIVQPIVNPEQFTQIGLDAPTGVLLWGPPGCGKTLLAKAVAAESKANFISVKGPELLDKYVGESEAAVRRLFTRARSSAPCIIFFDELDALTPHRDGTSSESSARVVNMLLTELDGLNDRAGLFVIAATNRPDMIDSAMLRPGRLERLLFVGIPGAQERVDIFRTLLRHKDIAPELADVVGDESCDGFTGADLSLVWRNAAQHALKRKATKVDVADLQHALEVTPKSVADMQRYERMKQKLARRA